MEIEEVASTTGHTKPQQNAKIELDEKDLKKKEKEKIILDKLFAKIDAKKEEAAAQFKKGMYEVAAKIYRQAAEFAEDEMETIKFYKRELVEKEA